MTYCMIEHPGREKVSGEQAGWMCDGVPPPSLSFGGTVTISIESSYDLQKLIEDAAQNARYFERIASNETHVFYLERP